MEKIIKQWEAKSVLEDKHFKFMQSLAQILLGVVGVPNKKEIPLTVPRTPAFVWKKRTQTHPRRWGWGAASNDKNPTIAHDGGPLKSKIPVRTVEMRPFCFDTKMSLIEGEEIKTAAERGGGTF